MKIEGNVAKDVKIAYIGGGSRGWAWGLMSDLAKIKELSGKVVLYDIDYEAAKNNEIIGNSIKGATGADNFCYEAVKTLKDALTGADFVIISILPGTFDEMDSDVHHPEKYGIYQSVGDTVGPGGVIRALRTIPMFEGIAKAIKEFSPDAWVINYTNPMTVCVRTLYKVFPEIKAVGCCHEVFGTQKFLADILGEVYGIEAERDDIHVNVTGINHFTWLTKASYKNMDLFGVYADFCEKNYKTGYVSKEKVDNFNKHFTCLQMVKMDLFRKFGYIAAAGDRHLAEFCPGNWYLSSEDAVEKMGFHLTSVDWRKEELKQRLEKSAKLVSGEEKFVIKETGEEGALMMKALLGLGDLTTNVNTVNRGQIPNLPLGAVVETNAYFTANDMRPVMAGELPMEIYGLIARHVSNQEMLVEAGLERNLEKAFSVFINDPNVCLTIDDARKMFNEMVENTKTYLTEYFR